MTKHSFLFLALFAFAVGWITKPWPGKGESPQWPGALANTTVYPDPRGGL